MPPTRTQVRCPRCGVTLQADVEQVIDTAQDPAGKARLLSGSLNLIRCPACGYEGQLATPIVYHDPRKELLLSYFPVELGLPKNEQERVLGQLLNQVIQRLPPEKRKAYLLQPQPVLTPQGLVERVLAADGVTRKEIEAQRAKMRLFEEILRAPQDQLERLVTEHDAELDEGFFQLAGLALRSAPDPRAQEAFAQRLDRVFDLSTFGKKLAAQEAEVRAAAESLQSAGPQLTREKVLGLILDAPNDERVRALASLARPALDYTFFQLLTERIEAAQGAERERMGLLRQQLLDVTQQIDRAQQARVAQAAEVLKAIAQAKDTDAAIRQALPYIDELFLGVLEANLRAAKERGDSTTASRLEQVSEKIRSLIQQAIPKGLRLAQQVLEAEDEGKAMALVEASAADIDDDFLQAMLSTAQRLEAEEDAGGADEVRRLYRAALRHSMRAKMQAPGADARAQNP
ncbi:MAG: CpXC domain-containing protein [Chloroflexota bacterium]